MTGCWKRVTRIILSNIRVAMNLGAMRSDRPEAAAHTLAPASWSAEVLFRFFPVPLPPPTSASTHSPCAYPFALTPSRRAPKTGAKKCQKVPKSAVPLHLPPFNPSDQFLPDDISRKFQSMSRFVISCHLLSSRVARPSGSQKSFLVKKR